MDDATNQEVDTQLRAILARAAGHEWALTPDDIRAQSRRSTRLQLRGTTTIAALAAATVLVLGTAVTLSGRHGQGRPSATNLAQVPVCHNTPSGQSAVAYVATTSAHDQESQVDAVALGTRRLLWVVGLPARVGTPVALQETGAKLWVLTNQGEVASALVSIDLSSHKVDDVVALGAGATGFAVSPNGSEAYVATPGADELNSLVVPVNLATGKPATAINIGSPSFGVAFSPDGHTLYVTARTNTAIRLASGVMLVTVDTSGPIVVSPAGGLVITATWRPTWSSGGPAPSFLHEMHAAPSSVSPFRQIAIGDVGVLAGPETGASSAIGMACDASIAYVEANGTLYRLQLGSGTSTVVHANASYSAFVPGTTNAWLAEQLSSGRTSLALLGPASARPGNPVVSLAGSPDAMTIAYRPFGAS